MKHLHLLDLGRETRLWVKGLKGQDEVYELRDVMSLLGYDGKAYITRELITEEFVLNIEKPLLSVIKDIMKARSSSDEIEYAVDFYI